MERGSMHFVPLPPSEHEGGSEQRAEPQVAEQQRAELPAPNQDSSSIYPGITATELGDYELVEEQYVAVDLRKVYTTLFPEEQANATLSSKAITTLHFVVSYILTRQENGVYPIVEINGVLFKSMQEQSFGTSVYLKPARRPDEQTAPITALTSVYLPKRRINPKQAKKAKEGKDELKVPEEASVANSRMLKGKRIMKITAQANSQQSLDNLPHKAVKEEAE